MDDKKKKSDRIFIAVMALIALCVAIFMVYSMFFKPSDTDKSSDSDSTKSSAIILPDVESDTTEKTKSSIYEIAEETEKTEAQRKAEMQKDDFYKLGDSKKNTTTSNINASSSNKTTSNTSGRRKATTTNRKQTSTTSSATTQQTYSQPIQQQNDNSNEYAFGVYKAKNNTSSGSSSSENTGYIAAILEKSQKIKNGSEVIFILQNSAVVNGIKFDKMAIMYGIAAYNGTRVDITINTIQDKTGKKHPVNLEGYNENYQKGIYYSDKIENATSQSKSSAITSAASKTVGRTAAGQIATGTIQALSTRERGEINVAGGYKMYFK